MKSPHVTSPMSPRSAALARPRHGERIADSATTRSTDVDLGHATFRTLENAETSPLTTDQAAGLGRLVRRIVNSPTGLPNGFDTVEDLCRGYLDRQLSAPTGDQTKAAMQRTLERLRTPGA
ncbi:hypothetical protein [Rhodococcus sp. NPDC003348]